MSSNMHPRTKLDKNANWFARAICELHLCAHTHFNKPGIDFYHLHMTGTGFKSYSFGQAVSPPTPHAPRAPLWIYNQLHKHSQ